MAVNKETLFSVKIFASKAGFKSGLLARQANA